MKPLIPYTLALVTAKLVITTKKGISDLIREVKKIRNILDARDANC